MSVAGEDAGIDEATDMDDEHSCSPYVYKEVHERMSRKWMGLVPIEPFTLPLWEACAKGDAETVRQLVRQGHSVNAFGEIDVITPIYAAITRNQNEIITVLNSLGADLSVQNNVDHTPLMWACHFNVQSVRQLLILGADVYQTNDEEHTALHIAVEIENISAVRMLLQEAPGLVNMKDMYGDEPLAFPCTYGASNPQLVKILLEYGADVNIAEPEDEHTCLHLAAAAGNREVMELLLQANPDVNALGSHALTPLHLAMINNQQEMVDMLLKAGAKIEVVDEEGETALFFACRYGKMEFFRALIPHMHLMEIYRTNSNNKSPLDLAKYFKYNDIVSSLMCVMQERTHLRGFVNLLVDYVSRD